MNPVSDPSSEELNSSMTRWRKILDRVKGSGDTEPHEVRLLPLWKTVKVRH